jgi:hypothetical protein
MTGREKEYEPGKFYLKGHDVFYAQDVQKALQEERKQSGELRQVWKDINKAIKERQEGIGRQQ